IHARSESNDSEALALMCFVSNLAVGDYAPRDESRNLTSENPDSVRSRHADRHLLILEAGFLGGGVEELALVVMHEIDAPVHRIPVDVNVEDVPEDRDPRRLAVTDQRLVDVRNHQDLAVCRRHDESRTARASPFRVAEEIRT